MMETIEFRIPEDDAQRYLGSDIGTTIRGIARKVEVSLSDPLFNRIGEIDRQFRLEGSAFFTAWIPHRRYTKNEIQAAGALRLIVRHFIEPSGEECGTRFDDSNACEFCGVGERQASDLIIDPRSLPKRSSLAIAKTFAGEIVVSAAFADAFQTNDMRGAEFRTLKQRQNPSLDITDWYQLSVESATVSIVSPTRGGNNPFDDDAEGVHRCPLSHTIGLNLISDLWISKRDFDGWDIACTSQRVGVRMGILRPEPLIVVSKKFCETLIYNRAKGMSFEVAHLT